MTDQAKMFVAGNDTLLGVQLVIASAADGYYKSKD